MFQAYLCITVIIIYDTCSILGALIGRTCAPLAVRQLAHHFINAGKYMEKKKHTQHFARPTTRSQTYHMNIRIQHAMLTTTIGQRQRHVI